jgi:hypothetical protein
MTAHLRQLVLRKVLPGALALLCLLPCYVGAYFWWKKAKLVNNWMERLADKPRIRIVVNNSHTLYSSEADEITWEQKRVDILERHYTADAVTLIGYIDEEETGWWSDVYQGWKKISKEKSSSFFLSWYVHRLSTSSPMHEEIYESTPQTEHPTALLPTSELHSPKKPPRNLNSST